MQHFTKCSTAIWMQTTKKLGMNTDSGNEARGEAVQTEECGEILRRLGTFSEVPNEMQIPAGFEMQMHFELKSPRSGELVNFYCRREIREHQQSANDDCPIFEGEDFPSVSIHRHDLLVVGVVVIEEVGVRYSSVVDVCVVLIRSRRNN